MAINFDKLERIDQSRKDTVSGFIRCATNKHIPEEIIHICMLFYALVDRFDPKFIDSEILKLYEETQSVLRFSCHGQTNVYLTNIVDSGHHKWTFRIVKRTSLMAIGIWRVQTNVSPPIKYYFTDGYDDGYAYILSYGKSSAINGGHSDKNYGVKVNDGDMVEMILDFDESSLSFTVNGIDYGKSHDVKLGKYRAEVHIVGYLDQIQFLG